ncbi:MAG: hypothetical protein U0807_00955 [Candidatus Binatia bacterium]
MIHVMLPAQYLRRADVRVAEPHKRLMAAVLQAVIDDCRGSGARRPPRPGGASDHPGARRAIAYVMSTDRAWPFSFENLCEALGLDAGSLRQELQKGLAA